MEGVDQVIKTPVTYGYSTATKIVMPLLPFFILIMGFIGAGENLVLSHALIAAAPFALISAFIALVFIREKITLYKDKLVFRKTFQTRELLKKDIKRVEIWPTRGGEAFIIIAKDGQKYKIPSFIVGYGELTGHISSLQGVQVEDVGFFGTRRRK